MAYSLLFTTIVEGALTGTGNALTMGTNAANPDAGVYMSLNPALQAPGWPPGTTTNNTQCGSAGILPTLPSGSIVMSAFLVYHGRVGFTATPTTVTFGTPIGTTLVAATLAGHTRYTDVTTLVSTAGAGTYSISQVPLSTYSDSEAGWALIVAYKNTSLPKRLLNIYAGEWATSLTATGFLTPSLNPQARIIYSETDMDPGYGLTLSINGVSVTGPNNPGKTGISGLTGQFFASQINILDSESPNVGQLDTSGTLGTYNYNGTTNGASVRWGCDLTNVSIAGALGAAATSLTAVVQNPFQSFVAGLQIDMGAPSVSIAKYVDKLLVLAADTLTYTVAIDNTAGNLYVTGVTLVDTLPSGTSFVPNSLKINGVTQAGANPSPPNGVGIATVAAGVITTITYQVTITNTALRVYPNSAMAKYVFQSNTITLGSNTVTTTIVNIAPLVTNKLVNFSSAFIGDTLTYTIGFENTGKTTATNIVFIDTIPNGTTLVTNSVAINGNIQSGVSPAPPSGITLPDIGINQTSTVTFVVQVTTIPSPNPTTNSGSTTYNYLLDPSIGYGTGVNVTNTVSTYIAASTLVKTVDKGYATIGDTLTYTLAWTNGLDVTQNNVVFVDTIPNSVTFVTNSIILNGVTLIGATITPPNGVNAGTLVVGMTDTLSFKVVINTLPSSYAVYDSATVTFNYLSNTILGTTIARSQLSNTVGTTINYANLGNIKKFIDKNYAACQDTITYTIAIPNVGNVTANNLIFIDTIPVGTMLINNSLTVNGVTLLGADPSAGVTLPDLGPGYIHTVTFKVQTQC